MLLKRLQLQNFRNITFASLTLSHGVNLIHGRNASGKTSLLEAIYFIGHLRSFRTSSLSEIINNQTETLEVTCRIGNGDRIIPVGIRRSKDNLQVRADQQNINRAADLAALFPVIAIHPESYRLINGSPAQRRQYMDWGVFHVEHAFFGAWQDYRKALSQRNAALKSGQGRKLCGLWNITLAETADHIDRLRGNYLEALRPEILSLAENFFPGMDIRMDYRRGWKEGLELNDVLDSHFDLDKKRGFTQSGPHRAEIVFEIGGQSVQHGVSRGQQKLMVALLKLAQARQYAAASGRPCVLLYDDLAAELDSHHRSVVLHELSRMPVQLFVSAIDRIQVDVSAWHSAAVFHVEHGQVSAD